MSTFILLAVTTAVQPYLAGSMTSRLILKLDRTMTNILYTDTRPSPAATQTAQTMDRVITRKVRYDYWLYLPAGYSKTGDKRWPLMIFLHGAGERGTDINLVKKHGPPKLADQKKDFPFIIVSPQCPSGQWWDAEAVNVLVDEIIAEHAVDPTRVYLTGLSMGGYGTWDLACRHPERFAAIAPICGGGIPFLAFDNLKKMPTWAFHGAKDQTVPLSESERMVEALKNAGAEVKFTVYPDAGHDSWSQAYGDPELYRWLLSHRK